MHKMLLEIPTHFETERLRLRCYEPGDGQWYYPMIQRNKTHLMPFEADNIAMPIKNEEDAEVLIREMAAHWVARDCFFMGAWEKATDTFVAQLYIGAVNWDLPEFEVGYFVDKDHEGRGFVTEAVKGALEFIFEHLQAHKVRLCCDDTNERSYRVAERCGFVREGHLRETRRWQDGTLHGTLYYGMLKQEFETIYR
jgi:ribosomal-protein-alanine N-acetyltransferase